MRMNANQALRVMFKEDEQLVLLANGEFQRAMAEFDSTADGLQSLAYFGTSILLPEERRPSLRRDSTVIAHPARTTCALSVQITRASA